MEQRYFYKDAKGNHYSFKSPLWREELGTHKVFDEEIGEEHDEQDVYTPEELENQEKFIPITEADWYQHLKELDSNRF